MSDHYRGGSLGIEVLDILKDKLTKEQFIGFCIGNIVKYTLRANFKGQEISDLKKAAHYGRILDEFLESQKTISEDTDNS